MDTVIPSLKQNYQWPHNRVFKPLESYVVSIVLKPIGRVIQNRGTSGTTNGDLGPTKTLKQNVDFSHVLACHYHLS